MLAFEAPARKAVAHRSRPHGFTLVELLVTVSIITISLSVVGPDLSLIVANYRLRSAAESILNGINLARTEAVRNNEQVTFALVGAQSDWTVTDSGGTVIQSHTDTETGGLSAASSNAATSVAFLPTGIVNATGTWLTQITVSSSTAHTESRQINVLGGGLIRMCDPAASTPGDPRRC